MVEEKKRFLEIVIPSGLLDRARYDKEAERFLAEYIDLHLSGLIT